MTTAKKPKQPRTSAEWTEAVNVAECMLRIDSARKYGLVTGGPDVNIERCQQILRDGKRHGYFPDEITVAAIAASMAKPQ